MGRVLKKSQGAVCRSWHIKDESIFESSKFEITSLASAQPVEPAERVCYESTEAFLSQFYNKPNLRETFMHHNLSPKEKHAEDINHMADISFRRSVNSFSHMINPLFGGD